MIFLSAPVFMPGSKLKMLNIAQNLKEKINCFSYHIALYDKLGMAGWVSTLVYLFLLVLQVFFHFLLEQTS